MQVDVLRENDNYIEALQTATHSADFGLDNLPSLLTTVITEDRWQVRWVRSLKREVTFASFADFATARTPAGLGTSIEMLKRMCRDNRTALDALDKTTAGTDGAPIGNQNAFRKKTTVDNVHIAKNRISPTGNATDTALRRLRKDSPSLHARVLAGELSPHAAMIEAGFRTRTVSIRIDPESAARSIVTHFDPDQVSELIACLYEEIRNQAGQTHE
ncbi:MAG: hypothetical protein ACR2OE_14925 [Thermomicrobiales bacterium]